MQRFDIREGGLDTPEIAALVAHHAQTAHANTQGGCGHAFSISQLDVPEIRFFSAWDVFSARDRAALLGIAALKLLDTREGEIKSCHTSESARGRGVATSLLTHIEAIAHTLGLTRLVLETHPCAYFAPPLLFTQNMASRRVAHLAIMKTTPQAILWKSSL
jgi:putative acetyltransferase